MLNTSVVIIMTLEVERGLLLYDELEMKKNCLHLAVVLVHSIFCLPFTLGSKYMLA
jgi:hypothetical protein